MATCAGNIMDIVFAFGAEISVYRNETGKIIIS
jgi:hypothetical protein